MKFLLSLLLCFLFILPRAEATAPLVKQISEEDMRKLLENPAVQRKIILLAENEDPKKKAEEEAKKDTEDKIPVPPQSGPDVQVTGGSNFNMNLGSSEEAALVVFAVVGVVVVVAWLAYFPLMVFEAARHGSEKYHFPQVVHLSANAVEGNKKLRDGYFGGVTYNLFLENKKDPLVQPGLGLETGYFRIQERRGMKTTSEGGYWLAGPAIKFNLGSDQSKGFIKADLLGGSSYDRDLGLVSKAQLSLMLGEDNLFVGLNFGALYTHVKNNKGVADDITNTGLILGLSFGHSF